MRLNDLVSLIEAQRVSISESKVKLINLLHLQKKEFDPAVAKKFDLAINNLGKMLVNLYSEIDYKVPHTDYNDKRPFYTGKFDLERGYNPDTKLSIIIGKLNKSEDQIKDFNNKETELNYKNIINHSTMSKVKLTTKYFGSQKLALAAVRKVLKGVKEISFSTEEK